ncbi:MAG: fibronectin type III domain-containing protein [Deltaproteobacteria bacterium]|nr:fibronectin type III domain-containing protein [Deltaproteobacteria bacterium]
MISIRRAVPLSAAVFALAAGIPLASAAPRWERLSWTGPTDTTMTVTWTDDAAGTGQVEFRRAGEPDAASVPGDAAPTGSGDLDNTYPATLTGLAPSTEYEYRVQSGGEWGDWFPFRTAPAVSSCEPIRFAALGDNRGQDILGLYIPSLQWDDVAIAVAGEAPLFTLDTGDFIYDGSNTGQWPPEMNSTTPLSRVSPFFLVQGNHDDGPGEGPGASFNKMFNYPLDGPDGVDDYYQFVAGNVLVVGLSNYSYSFDAQIDWLRTLLEAHVSDVDWRVVFFHTPVWSSGAHGSNENDDARADRLVPLLDEFGVDVVLNGHDHDYERFHPSRGGYGGEPRVWTPLPLDGETRGVAEGTTYIVTGGGGALANPIFTATLEGNARGSNHLNFVLADVEGGTMRLTARDCGQQLTSWASADCSGELETIVLEKESPVCPTAADADADADAADAEEEADSSPPDAVPDVPAEAAPEVSEDSPVDAPAETTTPPSSGGSGCGCRATGGPGAGLVILALGLLGLVRRRG